MTNNQKIAVGCGAVGCLGLIVIAIGVGGFFYWKSQQVPPRPERGVNFNFNTNSNLNQNSNESKSENTDANDSLSSMSDDDRHKMFQAASMTKDGELMQKVLKKIGLFKSDGTPAADYEQFLKDHVSWAVENTSFIASVSTPETARAYVDAHLEP